jgi:hypothetical protein
MRVALRGADATQPLLPRSRLHPIDKSVSESQHGGRALRSANACETFAKHAGTERVQALRAVEKMPLFLLQIAVSKIANGSRLVFIL